MEKILNKAAKIRDLVNHPWKIQSLIKDLVKWNKICASMDVIEDSELAIQNYFSLPGFNGENGGYLYLYGVLQAFFLQQDAINHLSEALFNEPLNWKKEYNNLYFVRELRNDSIGHPTNRNGGDSFHYISRHSVSKIHFQLMSYYPKKDKHEFRDIFLQELKEKQEKAVSEILTKTIKYMEKEFKDHKKKFMNKKMIDLIPGTYRYYIGKVQEGIYSNYQLAEMHFRLIKKLLNE